MASSTTPLKIDWQNFNAFWAQEGINGGLQALGVQPGETDCCMADSSGELREIKIRRSTNHGILQRYVHSIEFPPLVKENRIDIDAVFYLFEDLKGIFDRLLKEGDENFRDSIVVFGDYLKNRAIGILRTLSQEEKSRVQQRVVIVSDRLFRRIIEKGLTIEDIARAKRDKMTFSEKLLPLETNISKLALKLFGALLNDLDRDTKKSQKLKGEWENLNVKVIVHLNVLEGYALDEKVGWLDEYNRLNGLVKTAFKNIKAAQTQSTERRLSLFIDTSRKLSSNFRLEPASPLATPGPVAVEKRKFIDFVEEAIFTSQISIDPNNLEFFSPQNSCDLGHWQTLLDKYMEFSVFVETMSKGEDPYVLSAYAFSEKVGGGLVPTHIDKEQFSALLRVIERKLVIAAKEAFSQVNEEEIEIVISRLHHCSSALVTKLKKEMRDIREAGNHKIQMAVNLADLLTAFQDLQSIEALFAGYFSIMVQNSVVSETLVEEFIDSIKKWMKGKNVRFRSVTLF